MWHLIKILLMGLTINPCLSSLHIIKLPLQSAGKLLRMESILATALLRTLFSEEPKMGIEYHLQRPSIGVFLWTVITKIYGGIQKNRDVFTSTRNEFYKEYVLPIGQSLGYDGVDHRLHFDKDFFAPYRGTNDKKVYPSIRGHGNSPLEEARNEYHNLLLMEKEILKATKIIPGLYKKLLNQK